MSGFLVFFLLIIAGVCKKRLYCKNGETLCFYDLITPCSSSEIKISLLKVIFNAAEIDKLFKSVK